MFKKEMKKVIMLVRNFFADKLGCKKIVLMAKNMNKEDKIDGIADCAGGTANVVATTALSKICNPVFGGILGSVVGTSLKMMSKDVLSRLLSKKERSRIETVATMSLEKISDKMEAGSKVRNDGFFESGENSTAAQIFEGVLLVARDTYEEKKLELLSNLYSNIAFDEEISSPIANQLIKLSHDLTYRQLLILRCVELVQVSAKLGIETRKQVAYTTVEGVENVAIAIDIFDLYRRGCISSKTVILDPAGIKPVDLFVTGYGALLWKLMDMEHRSQDELEIDILNFLNEHPVAISKV